MQMGKFIDKFNVINKLSDNEINYLSLIKNYLENYFESNINIYHPDYINQLIWNKKINSDDINKIFDEMIANVLIQKRQNIRNLIKKEKFNLCSLNQLINNFNSKILKLKNILSLKTYNMSNNIRSILSDPIVINYLQNEFSNLDEETILDIQKLINILSNCSVEDYNWFLKLIGHVLRNNIVSLNVNIPDKYKYLYEFNNIIEYIDEVYKIYNFLGQSLSVLLNPIYEITLLKFITCIDNCNTFIELSNLIDTKIVIIDKLFKQNDRKQIANTLGNKISTILNIELIDNEIVYLLKLMIKCKKYDLLESYILLIFEDEKIINLVLNIIHETINWDIEFIKHIINLLKINNKDQFINKYNKLLIQRILSNETKLDNEKIIINELSMFFGPKVINKSLKIITDYNKSKEELTFYKEKTKIDIFNTITTSYVNWDINYNQGYVTFENNFINNEYTNNKYTFYNEIKKILGINTNNKNKQSDFESFIVNYQKYYNTIYEGKRKLLWLLQYGEVEITYNDIKIILLPIQLMVLELYNIKYEFSFEEICNQTFFTNYSNKFKQDIINSLIYGNILVKNNDKLYLNENTSSILTNLIDVYLDNTSTEIIPSQVNQENELSHTREDIVKTLINHNLKLNPSDKDILFDKLVTDITVFKLTLETYNKTIDKMIKYDYITMNNNILVKCLY